MRFKDWWTNENNPNLSKSEYLYSGRHILVLLSVLILCIVFTLIFMKKSQRTKSILFNIFGYIFIFFEVLSRVVNLILANEYTIESVAKILLPMHMCSVMVFVFIIAIFTKKEILLNFSVIGGLLATIAFLLYPAVGLNRVYMSFTCIYSTFTHALGFITVVLMITLRFVKFEFKKIWQPFLCFAIMFLWGALLNFIIFPGSDYMYMVNDPLELGLNFPYQILYVALIAVYITIFYIINYLIKVIKTKHSK